MFKKSTAENQMRYWDTPKHYNEFANKRNRESQWKFDFGCAGFEFHQFDFATASREIYIYRAVYATASARLILSEWRLGKPDGLCWHKSSLL